MVAIVVGAVALGYGFSRQTGPEPAPSGSPSAGPTYTGPSHLVLFAVTATPEPFVALVGSRGGKHPAVVDVPSRMVLTMPGAGSGTVADAAAASGSLLAASVSNEIGTWVGHQAVTDPAGFARLVDASGGVEVDLVQPVEVDGTEIAAGRVRMSGDDATAFLTAGVGPTRAERWREILAALFRDGLTTPPDELTEADDPAAVAAVFAAARAPVLGRLPATPSNGHLLVPADRRVRRMLWSLFGIEVQPPIGVVVLNGSGVPGVGEAVASRLVPGGFQIVASGNAGSFDHAETQIVATTEAAKAQAERVRGLLGVGTVVLGGGPSGLADITIVVGRDFTGV